MASTNVYKIYEDEEFTSADSPVVLNISSDLSTLSGNGDNQYANSLNVYNTGNYDLQLEISMDGTTYGDSQVVKSKSVDNLNSSGIKAVRLTHLGNDTGYQVKAFSRNVGDASLTPGGVNSTLIDDNTEPQDLLFAQSLGQFTTAVATPVSTTTILEYDFTATAGHGIIAGDEILLIASDRSFRASVTNVATNVITVDTPIDFEFDAGSIGLIINTNMAVDGSVTPQIFKIQAGTTPILIRRIIMTITDQTSMDDAKFGGITALTNGVVFRLINSFQKSIFNIKSNGDWRQWGYDLDYADKAPSGFFGVSSRITFGGKEKHGVVLKLSGTDELQLIVQDDLTGLDSFRLSTQGNKFS